FTPSQLFTYTTLFRSAHPLSVGYDKAHDVIYVSCQQYLDVTAIDGTTHQPIGSPIEVGSSPFGIAYNERNGDVYIVIAHTDEVVVLDGATRTIVRSEERRVGKEGRRAGTTA